MQRNVSFNSKEFAQKGRYSFWKSEILILTFNKPNIPHLTYKN